MLREWLDGRVSLRFKGKDLEYKEVDMVRPKPAVRVFVIMRRRKPPKYIYPPHALDSDSFAIRRSRGC